MSYSILYNRQFVKVADNLFIPMIEAGDNNVYESGKKRARSWYNQRYVTDGAIWASPETILSNIDKIREERIASNLRSVSAGHLDEGDKYEDKRFGWHEGVALYGRHTTGTTFLMYRNFYKTGIEKALTIEQLIEKGVCLHMKIYYWKPEEITSNGKEIKHEVQFTSTEHLVNTVNEWVEYYGEMAGRIFLYFRSDWAMEQLVKSQKDKKEKKKKEWVESKTYYVLEGENGGNGYFVKATALGYKYAYTSTGARKFLTEKAAMEFHKRMKYRDLFKVKFVEHQYSVSVLA